MTHLSPVQLLRHVYTTVEVGANPALDFPIAKENYQIAVDFKLLPPPPATTNQFSVELTVRLGPSAGEAPWRYKAAVVVRGLLELSPGFPDDAPIEQIVRLNGGSLLMGAVRELIMTLTARSEWGPLELPAFDARMFLTSAPAAKIPKIEGDAEPKRAQAQ